MMIYRSPAVVVVPDEKAELEEMVDFNLSLNKPGKLDYLRLGYPLANLVVLIAATINHPLNGATVFWGFLTAGLFVGVFLDRSRRFTRWSLERRLRAERAAAPQARRG